MTSDESATGYEHVSGKTTELNPWVTLKSSQSTKMKQRNVILLSNCVFSLHMGKLGNDF